MRTRSSRLFFVLLHLVGVSTNVPSNNKPYSSSSSTSTASPSFLSLLRKHRPSWLTRSTGIIGVHPTAIFLERLQVESSRRGLKGIVERVEQAWGWDGDNDLLGEPYWFQDNADGKCLSPSGFSECGDATLWRVRRRPLTKKQLRQKRQKERQRRMQQQSDVHVNRKPHYDEASASSSVCVWPFFCEQDSQVLQSSQYVYDEIYGFENEDYNVEEGGFAIQLMDVDATTANTSLRSEFASRRRMRRRLFWNSNKDKTGDDSQAECLLSFPSKDTTLQIGPCSLDEAWTWHVNKDGVLVRGATKAEKRKKRRRWIGSPRIVSSSGRMLHSTQVGGMNLECVHRVNTSSAILFPCQGDAMKEDDGASLVGFSLVRYPSASSIARGQATNNDNEWAPWTTLEGLSTKSVDGRGGKDNATSQTASNSSDQHLPTSRTSSQNHASGPKQRHVEVKSTESMLRTGLGQGSGSKPDSATKTSASHILNAPITVQGKSFHEQQGDEPDRCNVKSPAINRPRIEKSNRGGTGIGGTEGISKPSLLHKPKPSLSRQQLPNTGAMEERGGGDGGESNTHRPIKIPVHPYIESSKDGVWVDPLTSLEYPTDLCDYLGQTKKEAGRHTLMGVGQYYRTAFNIKVYGAALYVAKRDVLADPKFGRYAALSPDELSNRDDFYDHLMSMPSPGEDPAVAPGGFFDRTLMVKTNMQLSTDAMRKSLEADWSLLTDEMKSLIIESSFRERMADDRMLEKIKSKENSSRCSCGQSAPPEYEAEASCCARGTELVFTWRKNGDFEIRLDGRVMDIFPRPDMAKGIFSEYMNDNPISVDAKKHFVDGFPFLLAPLAQVKGMSSAVPIAQESTKRTKDHSSNPMLRLMDVAMQSMDTMNTQAHTLSKWMQDGAAEMSYTMETALGGAVGVARGLSAEFDRQRLDMLESAFALQGEGLKMLTSLMASSVGEEGSSSLTIMGQNMSKMTFSHDKFGFNGDTGFKATALEIMPDEIGIEIEPAMNFSHWLFFTTVHVYLALLFIVSLQGSNTSKLVVKRRFLETEKCIQSKSLGAFVTCVQKEQN
ncbi:predicted protein [Thalassiosira pseudonana CCMP1335]|uniref:Ricin B lectin domain-containing protein n=1 Tax=Thalassiosira pseudonana TaxID=35128 RepID=B8BVM6_THAPS|nr:predicted protein [Thalassiosira pseudonana CCMP1335]EED94961.1 predicted protein [Thalassiosira pseudonana CCMP1335]